MQKHKPFWENETIKNITKVRTPTTPDNKYKRLGLLFIGLACIIAGVIIIIVSN